MQMDRRSVLKFGAGISAVLLLARSASLTGAFGAPDEHEAANKFSPKEWEPFTEEVLLQKARLLAQSPYVPPADTIPEPYKHLTYDQYRDIRFKRELGIWRADNLGYAVELFHAGYIYRLPVQIFIVDGERAGEVQYDSSLFTFGPRVSPPTENSKTGFSGLRIHGGINGNGQLDEFAVFQGASYFRSKAAGQDYGISARGLAINTGRPPADEFPIFRSFWVVKPDAHALSITVFALLDSESITGAYKFVISTSHNTLMDVDCTLFPRAAIKHPGIAPLTSMFFFAPSDRHCVDEVRPRIHDSDGLLIWNGKGERIWRPLINPNRIQFSSFLDRGIHGFGLLQRERRPDRYQDFDAHYELRPSVWVEPREEWGEGAVDLVELTTQNEYFDNIVAFWRPKDPLEPGRGYTYRYRLTWCYEPPIRRDLAIVAQTLVGASTQHAGMRLLYVDFSGTEAFNLCDDDFCQNKHDNVELSASAGTIVNVAFRRNKISGGHRVGFEYLPEPGVTEADLRCALVSGGKPVSEVWIYRWSA